MKTRTDVAKLKQLWLDDKSAFKLDEVAGFEAYKEELEAFMKKHTEEKQEDEEDILSLIGQSVGAVIAMGRIKGKQELLDKYAYAVFQERIKTEDLRGDFTKIGYDSYSSAHQFLEGRDEFFKKLISSKGNG